MEEYLVFARNHPVLILGLVAVLGMIIWTEIGRLTRKYKQVNSAQAVQILNQEDSVVLDVREDNELRGGKIKGARHIPLGQLKNRLGELEQSKGKPVLVYCRSGNRSSYACQLMTKAGFQDVNNLAGGIMAWESANLPVSKR
ncbi:rhodanese-like domain-containing protein [Candidatus Thiothrix sp. Deng01]|uniref:Rhodanese-like domain-containing protein n=1 Tax=Candidatus Thiothrix phosphatis TaxID=3112415 RepID=A0ABU6CUD4_9GAMM|nr:rhodanese-like domain-containing protein [Candidatus Thiothrix sp. Deng01]MEB4590420.1 rhodanese-like domain-containing protein [Candidatus Thiothrix sp. Deng01]